MSSRPRSILSVGTAPAIARGRSRAGRPRPTGRSRPPGPGGPRPCAAPPRSSGRREPASGLTGVTFPEQLSPTTENNQREAAITAKVHVTHTPLRAAASLPDAPSTRCVGGPLTPTAVSPSPRRSDPTPTPGGAAPTPAALTTQQAMRLGSHRAHPAREHLTRQIPSSDPLAPSEPHSRTKSEEP